MRHQALRGTHPLTTEGSRIIRRRLRGKRGRARQTLTTLSQNKEAQALRELKAENWDQVAIAIRRKAHQYNPVKDIEEYQNIKVIKDKVKDQTRKKQTNRQDIYKAAILSHQRTPAQEGLLIENRLDYHSRLRKAESSIAIQLRSGKNGFNHFLYKMKVPGVYSARCSCGQTKQDTKHILLYYPKLSQQRPELLKEVGTHDVRTILIESKGVRVAARQIVKSGQLG